MQDITEERMVAMMVGRAITQTYPKVACEMGDTVLEVKTSATRPNLPISTSLCVKGRSSASTVWWAPGVPN
jgi:ABC-type uncharacterized transport system ATPase subunit